jgi:hypothetical protein
MLILFGFACRFVAPSQTIAAHILRRLSRLFVWTSPISCKMVSKHKSKGHLSGGAIAGIVIAIVAVVLLILAAAFYVLRRRRYSNAQSSAQRPVISSPMLQTSAPQLPNPAVSRFSDNDVERMYLKDFKNSSDSFGGPNDRNSRTIITSGDRPDQAAPRGKLAALTGESSPQRAAPKGRIKGLKPADERRSVPYRPGDFA